MTLIAYDSSDPANIPVNAAVVFPYSDGRYVWPHTQFPRAMYRYITVRGDTGTDIADFEPGAIWPGEALRTWAEARRARFEHADLTVYCGRNNFAAAKTAMAGLTWHLFLSTLDGSQPQSYGGMQLRACQFTDRQNKYDMSVVYDQRWLNKPA
jgi:hypothetical protein